MDPRAVLRGSTKTSSTTGSERPGPSAICWRSKFLSEYDTPATTALVLRSGTPLYGDAPLVAGIPGGANCDEVPLCEAQKRICLQAEIGQGFAALEAANARSYALTFCGIPPSSTNSWLQSNW